MFSEFPSVDMETLTLDFSVGTKAFYMTVPTKSHLKMGLRLSSLDTGASLINVG